MKDKNNIRVKELVKLIKYHKNLYYNNIPEISDQEFDRLVNELKQLDPKNKELSKVGAKVSSKLKKVKHKIPMGSLEKVNTLDEVTDWFNKYINNNILWSEKVDGLSLEVYFENGLFKQAITRGDGDVGEDVTHNVEKINFKQKLNKAYTGYIRGEVKIDKDIFEKYFSEMKNPRNAASGVIRRLDSEKSNLLSIVFYQIDINVVTEEEKMKYIESLGLSTPNWGMAKNLEEIQKVWNEYSDKKRKKLNYEIDGLVLTHNIIKEQEELGSVGNKPRYARAYKFESEGAETILLNITNQVGRTGIITPVGEIEPVTVSGALISRVTLHNYKEVNRLGLKLNQKVIVERKGDVIPQITQVINNKGNDILIPKKCPCCESKLELSDDLISIFCLNHKDCKDQVVQNLLFWLQQIGVKGIAEKMVLKLFETKKVLKISDFYKLSVNDISSLERSGDKIAVKIIDELNNNKNLEAETFLAALGIDGLGDGNSKLLLQHFSLDDLINDKNLNLTSIHGIGDITAKSITSGLTERKKEIIDLLKIITIKEKSSGKLNGMSFCFTEVRDKQLENDLKSQGAIISDSVNKTLSFLIVKDINGSSSKIQKAIKLGIKIIPIDQVRSKFQI